MPLVRHQVHCCICLQPPDREHCGEIDQLISLWKSRGILSNEGGSIDIGGCTSLRIEEHPSPKIYGNHQGGYRVRCAKCRSNIVSTFSRAVQLWRAGQERKIACPFCGHHSSLEDCSFAPPVAFSRATLVLIDIERAELADSIQQELRDTLGDFRIVYRRIG